MKTSRTKAPPADLKDQRPRARQNGAAQTASRPPAGIPWWHYALAAAAVLIAAFAIYEPALSGPFLFDDVYLPFMSPTAATLPVRAWLGVRPLLMGSFWLNYTSSGTEPYWYHWVNVLFHALNSILAYAIVRRFLSWVGERGGRREILAGFAGLLFLTHPVQTESVAYVASRSEAMSVFFFLSALAVFVYRRHQAVTIPVAAAILFLFVCGASTKEHAVVLPGLLLLTDYFFNPGFSLEGIKRNWKLYVPVLAGGALGGYYVVRNLLPHSDSAGFGMKDLTWTDFLFSQFRAICTYLRIFVFPFGLNIDHDFPVSHSILDYGSIVYLAVLVALAVVAWIYRRRFPLASFGYFGCLLLLAPTSSVIPLRDLLVEHRLYLPFICLLLITVDFVRRWRTTPATLGGTLACVLLVMSVMTYNRNQVWASSVALWQDAATKSPRKARPRFQLAYAYWQAGRCVQATTEYAGAAKLQAADQRLLHDWALAEDCAGNINGAIDKFKQAAQMEPSAVVYSQIGMEYGKQGKAPEAFAALDQAERIDPRFWMTYIYRGQVYETQNDYARAKQEYTRVLAIDPTNQVAQEHIANLNQHMQSPTR